MNVLKRQDIFQFKINHSLETNPKKITKVSTFVNQTRHFPLIHPFELVDLPLHQRDRFIYRGSSSETGPASPLVNPSALSIISSLIIKFPLVLVL